MDCDVFRIIVTSMSLWRLVRSTAGSAWLTIVRTTCWCREQRPFNSVLTPQSGNGGVQQCFPLMILFYSTILDAGVRVYKTFSYRLTRVFLWSWGSAGLWARCCTVEAYAPTLYLFGPSEELVHANSEVFAREVAIYSRKWSLIGIIIVDYDNTVKFKILAWTPLQER